MKKYKILTLIPFLLFSHSGIFAQDFNRLVLEPGFKISIFADNLSSPRQIAEGKNGPDQLLPILEQMKESINNYDNNGILNLLVQNVEGFERWKNIKS